MPVRQVTNAMGNNVCYFPSIKMKRMIGCESLTERDYVYLIDYDDAVEEFEEQPVKIPYRVGGKGRLIWYPPDFRVRYADHADMVDVKPAGFRETDKDRDKFDAARTWCAEHGLVFRIVAADEITAGYRLVNVQFLTLFARRDTDRRIKALVLDLLTDADAALTLGQLTQQLAVTGISPSPRRDILQMAFRHEIAIAIDDAKIGTATPVWLPAPRRSRS